MTPVGGEADAEIEEQVEVEFDHLRAELNKDLAELKPPSILYQYTTTSAARSIVSSGKLWATDLAFMNDPTEWTYGHELFADALRTRAQQAAPEVRAVAEFLADGVSNRVNKQFLVLVASLCKHGDALALWRPYADDGAGCCVGIDIQRVADADKPGGAAATGLICDRIEQDQRSTKVVVEHLRLAEELRVKLKPSVLLRHLAWSLQVEASLLATCFKHSSYESEQEWRLVQVTLEGDGRAAVLRRDTAAGGAPYTEVDVSAAIVEIVLGPRHPEKVEDWRSWLCGVGLEEIAVRRSETPYRRGV